VRAIAITATPVASELQSVAVCCSVCCECFTVFVARVLQCDVVCCSVL